MLSILNSAAESLRFWLWLLSNQLSLKGSVAAGRPSPLLAESEVWQVLELLQTGCQMEDTSFTGNLM